MLTQIRGFASALLLTASFAAGFQAADQIRENSDCLKKRAQNFRRSRSYPKYGEACSLRLKAIQHAEKMPRSRPRLAAEPWKLLGPRPTIVMDDNLAGGPPIASGRVTSIAIDPGNSDIAYIGAAHGGVWKTVDAGRNWKPLTDHQISLAIGSLAIDPSNSQTVYAGTGEENFSLDSYFGVGILKSIDAGRTWTLAGTQFGTTAEGRVGAQIGALAIHPKNGRILLATVNRVSNEKSGVYRSTDAGLSWQHVLGGAPGSSVLFNPQDPRIAYAGLGGQDANDQNGIYKSSDGGLTWKRIVAGIPGQGVGRVSLAIAASKPDVLYAAIANPDSNDPLGVFKTVDGGQHWTSANTPSYCFGTCWYANSIAVSPENPDIAVVGGLQLYITGDGGESWLNVTQGANGNSIHWDIHALVFAQSGGRMFIGTDGGPYRADDIGSLHLRDIGWHNLNETLSITQFHAGCSAQTDGADFIICGTQDNGTQLFSGGFYWRMIAGGDGGFTALDPARSSVFYFSFAGMVGVNKSSPFTLYKGFLGVNTGLEKVDTDDCYVPPLAIDPANPQRLYMGCRRIYRTDDGGGLWSEAGPQLRSRPGASPDEGPPIYTYIAVAPSSSSRVYAAVSDGRVHVSGNATAPNGVVWESRGSGLPRRPVAWIAVDAASSDIAVAALQGFSGDADKQGHVFRTVNAGRDWADISGNLPDIPANTVIFDPGAPQTLFLGTDIGVFQTTNGGVTWMPVGTGLPRCPVVDLKLHAGGRLLRAATYGRGMWELKLPPMLQAPRPAMQVDSAAIASGAPPKLTVRGRGFTTGTVVRWNGVDRPSTLLDTRTLETAVSPAEAGAAERTFVSVRHPQVGVSNVVNLETGAAPSITRIANGAGGPPPPPSQTTSLAAGSMGTIFGQNLASRTMTAPLASAGQTLAGAVVEFKSFVTHLAYPATLFFVSPERIDFQVPWNVPQNVQLQVDVVQGTRMSLPVQVNIGIFSPGLFSVNQQGTGQGQIFCDSDGKLAGAGGSNARPAKAGEIVRLLATGLGPYSPGDAGQPQPIIGAVQVSIGGLPAEVAEAVALPPFAGQYLVKVKIPAGVPPGPAAPVTLEAGGVLSNQVTIAVQ